MKTRSFLRKVFRNSLGFIKLSLLIFCLFNSIVILAGIENLNFVAFDHQGTAKLLVNEDCEVVWPVQNVSEPNQLLPFGAEIHQSQDETIYDLNFTNKELDRELELHYFGARFYNAELCRFLSPDPIGGRPEDPLSWNRYLYCRNDPINRLDPDGRFDIVVTPTALAIYGGMAIMATWLAMPSPADPSQTNAEVIVSSLNEIVESAESMIEDLLISTAEDEVGSYSNVHESGKKYHGKGSEQRAKDSGKRIETKFNDPLVESEWENAENDREAFKAEDRRIQADGGVESETNYNIRNSPGKRYREQDKD